MKKTSFVALLIGALATLALTERPNNPGLVVHEWGTFTSFQGGDGVLLSWKPLVTSTLPGFIYDWGHPGLGRRNYLGQFPLINGQYYVQKSAMTTLQRMETPVVYFYSDKALTADLAVQFPRGSITEWFPQARQIGPSFVPPSHNLTSIDSFMHKLGAPAKLSFASMLTEKPVTNSMIHWSNIRIFPPKASVAKSDLLPTDTSGSHYFAARETDANLIRLDSLSSTNARDQYEKFLFYRGVGSFATPLRVIMKSDDTVTLTNTGKEPLAHLFVLDVKDKSGAFIYVAQLLPGEEKTVTRAAADHFQSPVALNDSLAHEMSQALVKEGLYPREAAAMVNTWKSSWFAEDGTRVLYVLPREWTDRTLPMTLTPVPRELTRVMVGRAEVFTPGLERNLVMQLDKARHGDSAAAAQVRQIAKSLGRFAEPAYYQALAQARLNYVEQATISHIFFDKSTPEYE
jgi:hypothetical protein